MKRGAILSHLMLGLSAFVILLPFGWIVLSAFKRQIDIVTSKVIFTPVMLNFDELLFSRSSTFLDNFTNSLIVAGASTAIALFTATTAAFSLRQKAWAGWVPTVLLTFSMIYYMTPQMTLVGSWYQLFRAIGLNNTLFAIIITHATVNLPMALWLMNSFVADAPRELEEAAVIDGCSRLKTFTHVILPVIVPGLMATGVLMFVFSWNEFPVALALTTKETATVPVSIAKFAQDFEVKHGAMAAAATLSTIPAILMIIFATKYIVRGLTSGALK
ncbi:carbohydrate ABC transporter permease [Paracoccus seriniphilus]|uniref:Carbohydrate ABC transporter membrane protein 2, CUT1 family n=1 Tax=Paracoccus seriniphilus TaxID=184748 RepID=A0A239Q392_9RHOB|nr:carbohydrate ABC transporter permease [Paracoccus seriniphilus]WCR15971.1 carbohydrate ABC transporter permease [Paracoccus seriniphilus]SNT76662.1 carbohydrate ABC transporter membrane protein 2, CUT1 family [Paracoccus seriniphilus]